MDGAIKRYRFLMHVRSRISLTYNLVMMFLPIRVFFVLLVSLSILLSACSPESLPSAEVQLPDVPGINGDIPPGFLAADGSHVLTFPADFGAHPDYRTEWWYYTGNLETPEQRHFGFELTIFRVSLLPPTTDLPADSKWYDRSVYFAHFAVSDVEREQFYAFERYSRPGPGLAGAQVNPYRVWLEDWSITESKPGIYRLQATQETLALDLTLTDEMGVVLHGNGGYSRKGQSANNASYYYSQPRLRANGAVKINGVEYPVSGLAWKDHEFSTSVLDANQIGWDWFSLQFDDGTALMLFQLREKDGRTSSSSSGTWIAADGTPQPIQTTEFSIHVLNEWKSPHTQGVYPSSWEIRLKEPDCVLNVQPWMADQEIHFPAVTYWEGAVHFNGTCNGSQAGGNGYVELTGYAGNLPLP